MEANPNQVAQCEDPKVVRYFTSLGISKQEAYIQQDNRIERLVTYAVTVPSGERAKHLIKKITMKVPEFIDNSDREIIESVIDNAIDTMRQKREASETVLEVEVISYPVSFRLTIQ